MINAIQLVLLFLTTTTAFYFLIRYFGLKKKIAEFKEQRKQNLLPDLELATYDDLLKELRSRSGSRFVMIRPMNDFNVQSLHPGTGLNIDINAMDMVSACSLLKMSSLLIQKDLSSKGIDVPEPEID